MIRKCLQVDKTVWDWELMNDIKPIWQRPSKEVEEDEYKAFYKSFSKVCCGANAWVEAMGAHSSESLHSSVKVPHLSKACETAGRQPCS